MQKQYFSVLIAGFDKNTESNLVKLLEEIRPYNPDADIRYQTANSYPDIINALSESCYRVCLLNSDLKNKINNKIINEITSRLQIQNKSTAVININTQDFDSNSDSNQDEVNSIYINTLNTNSISEIKLNNLNSYWLAFIIKSAIEKIQMQKEIKRLSHYDSLTGLVNRNLYLNHLNHALALAERENRFCTLIYLDINNFKTINDQYGFKIGDQVLIESAQRIKKTIRSVDIAARLGSDEFAVLLENCHPTEAKRIIIDLKKAMALPFNICSDKLKIEYSIDCASYPDSNSDKTSFLSNVRQAHYSAKAV